MGTRAHFLPMLDEDDDDDFQDPVPTFALAQSLPLSGRSPISRKPLRSSVAAPPRKKLKLPPVSGKENRPIFQGKARGESRQVNAAGRKKTDIPPPSQPVESLRERSEKVHMTGAQGSSVLRPKESEPDPAESLESGATTPEKDGLSKCEFSGLLDEFKTDKESMPKDSVFLPDHEKSTPTESQSFFGDHATDSPACTETKQGKNRDSWSWSCEFSGLLDEFKTDKESMPKDSAFLPDHEKSTPTESQSFSGDNATDSPACTETKQGKNSDSWSWIASNDSTDCNINQGSEFQCSLKIQDTCVASSKCSPSCNAVLKPTYPSGGLYTGSIESRLLQSRASCLSSITDCCPENNEGEEFEAGTQLKELMNLCLMVDDGEGTLLDANSGSGEALLDPAEKDSTFQLFARQTSSLVECPICGTDITDFSEEFRHVHTNECLDKDILPKVNMYSDGSNQQVMPKNDASQVHDFLASLGLSRYEEFFLKEEVDWDTLQWLTEEDLLSIGIVALGPRKKIIRALCQLREGNGPDIKQTKIAPREVSEESVRFPLENKLITEFFQSPSGGRQSVNVHSSAPTATETGISNGSVNNRNRKAVRNQVRMSKLRDIPSWCCVPGTQFRVDAFRYLRADCSHWFLTHFHMDHYQGLTKNFRHGKIYCSAITANLVNMKIGIQWDRLQVLPMGQKINIDGVGVTCLDANHCPGSVIILFEPPNGEVVLHTGDFRFCEDMANSYILRSCSVHTLILDTTYCNPQYDFPKQEAVIQFVIDAIQAEAFNPRTLFLIGSYTVGKERLFLEVARFLKKKIYVGAAKLRLLQCLGLPQEDMQWFTLNEMESQVHVVPMWTIASFKRMKQISKQYSARYNLIVAFAPTGWTFGKGRKKSPGRRWQQGTIIRYEVPYSEHSSFSELREFVQLVAPDVVIPSVNNNGPESAESMVALLRSSSPGSTSD